MEEKRILAIDFGKKRVGIAVSDPLNMFAIPLVTLDNDRFVFERLKEIVREKNIGEIILGYPLKEDGSNTHATKPVLEFKKELEAQLKKEVVLVDERYSSSIAWERIIESVPSRKKRRDKSRIDKGAAAVILEDYLNSRANSS